MEAMLNCQAIVEDREHPAYHASMQRIMRPGSKPCSRRVTVQVKHLHLCTVHARLAREGFIAESGVVAPKADIRNVRNSRRGARRLYDWAEG